MATQTETDLAFLRMHLEKYVSLTSEEFEVFSALLRLTTLKKDEFLLHSGDVCKFETFVTKGCLKSFYEDENGFQHIQDFLVEGWWAEDLYSFFTQTPSHSSIRAIENTRVIQISKNNLEKLYEKVPKFERFFRLLFQRAYIAQREQLNLILSTPANERYLNFLTQKPYAENRFTQRDIASYLGITPQFLSTLKKKR
jgi:CRP-like cAMP-binding protein